MNLTINPYNSNQKNERLTFKAGKVVYKEFKQIPNLTCACCGKKMIPPDAFEKFFKTVTRPLIQLIKKGIFVELFQNKRLATVLTNFAEKYPNDSLDKILSKPENQEAVLNACRTSRNNMYAKTKLTSRSELRSAGVVLNRLAPFRDIMSEDKKETYDLLRAYAKEHPRKTLSQIVQLDEVQNLHCTSNKIDRTKIKKLNALHFDKIAKLVKSDNSEINTDKIIFELKSLAMMHRVENENFTNRVKAYLLNSLSNLKNKRTKEKILYEAEFLQPFPQGADNFFIRAKKRKYNDFIIILQFFEPSMATFEHIKAKIDGGKDSIDNGIILCQNCNEERQNIPYSEFIQYHPMMPYNTQKQILQISDLILQGKVAGDCQDWPIKVASTLYENSSGKIDIDLTSYYKNLKEKSYKELKKHTEELVKAQNELEQKSAISNNSKVQSKDLQDEILALKSEIITKIQEINIDNLSIKQIKDLLEAKKK